MAKNALTKCAVNGLFQYKRRKAQNKNSLKVMKSLMVHLLNVFFWYQRRLRHYKMNYIYPFLRTECNLDIQINYIENPDFFTAGQTPFIFIKIQSLPQSFLRI